MAHHPSEPVFPVAGIILAAGGAVRMGQPKLLLTWQGETLVRRAARTALEARLKPVMVVIGAMANEIQQALSGLDVQFTHNPDWQAGQSTSVVAGIQALPDNIQAAMFVLADQPYVTPELIRQLVETYLRERPAILAPFVGEKRSNPVLFDRSLFGELERLQGDAGARSLFRKFPPAAMQWLDERLLMDVDTPEDYQRLIHTTPLDKDQP